MHYEGNYDYFVCIHCAHLGLVGANYLLISCYDVGAMSSIIGFFVRDRISTCLLDDTLWSDYVDARIQDVHMVVRYNTTLHHNLM